ncbi:penicillin-binding protein, transpeptidase domain protein [Leptospira inadai serovar Lyme str. 10]|uniref:Penicillin-binding protein, transpeptidase domain protein n=2 Tax=Leptospira inadai serovar Lyme TaxID=293084 RepID=V6HCN5_9LEPT|nr:penicillin-binding transpeptidase domain-containing protein [Leptospira inadai]EQA37701.1 penicillin-binding protein, transpeptidase domain protein [Leptospira inadai serovar Lyme str. 10]PNV73007.1 penicillin binding protein transpeptidase domain-containing protein [Leptospira inadai serovar Lyme]
MRGLVFFILTEFFLFLSCGTRKEISPPVEKLAEVPGRKICLIFSELETDETLLVNPKDCKRDLPPLHLFHPMIALAALEIGTLKEPDALYKWDKTKYPYIRWQKDQNLRTALASSTVWYFQKLLTETAGFKIQNWLAGTDLPKPSTLESGRAFWMDGDYALNGEELFFFLKKLVTRKLSVREKNSSMILSGLERTPGEVSNSTGIHRLAGNWGNAEKFYSDSGSAYSAGRSISLFWFYWKFPDKSFLFLSRIESESETLPPLEAARYGTEFLRANGIWEKFLFQ